MIDLYKYSKKNKFYFYLIKNILGVKTDSLDKSFYYVRVLENPTCRWSTWDAISRGYQPREDLHETIQERAWTSPIWYIPNASDVDVIPLGGTIQLRNID